MHAQHELAHINDVRVHVRDVALDEEALRFAQVAHDDERPVQRLVHGHDDEVLGEQVDMRRPLAHARMSLVRVAWQPEPTTERVSQLKMDAVLSAPESHRIAGSVSSFLKKKQLKKWNLRSYSAGISS